MKEESQMAVELDFVTTAEAGRICDPPLTPASIRRAADLGQLRVATRTASGQRLFLRADVNEFAARRGARFVSTAEME